MKFLWLTSIALLATPAGAASPREEVEAFNERFAAVTRQMDNAGAMALWAEDGVSLLPEMAPMQGRARIGKFLDEVASHMKGWHVISHEAACHDIDVSGDRASEWCETHQVVQPSGGLPRFDIHGKMLLVLRKGGDGAWRLQSEMWNRSPAPEVAPSATAQKP